jgi:Phage portal protein, SPP1 Gp6-like
VASLEDYGEPLWWVARLEERLDADQRKLHRLDDYYEGRHRLAFATSKFRDAFGDLFGSFADNWCDLVVDSAEERLSVQGFRLDDVAGDKEAWRIWQANNLDAESGIAHTEALVHSRAYALVWPNDADETTPVITIEHPTQVVVAHSAANRKLRLAALKRYIDDDGYKRVTLYTPEFVFKFKSAAKVREDGTSSSGKTKWEQLELPDETWPLENPFGRVPIVPLVNRRRLLNDGVSEIARVIPVQDAVNKTIADMLVASEFGAAPQRWATGMSVPTNPATGQPLPDLFPNLVSRLWTSKSDKTNFGQFPQTDLAIFVAAIEMLVQHIASQTRTPPHYFYLRGQFPSGESIKSAETGLVAKVRRMQRQFSDSWEEVIQLAFLAAGDVQRAGVVHTETLWGDPESRSEAEHTDAIVKQKALGVPDEALWEELGKTPQQIERYRELVLSAARTPGAVSPDDMTYAERIDALGAYVRAGFDPDEAAQSLNLPPVAHTGYLPVTVQGPQPAALPVAATNGANP